MSPILNFGRVIDNILSWSNSMVGMVSKLSSVCYVLRYVTICVALISNNDLLLSLPPHCVIWYYTLVKLIS